MTQQELHKLRFPVGEYSPPQNVTANDVKNYIAAIEAFPDKVKDAVKNLSHQQLNTPYRPNGWTIKQVIHHVGDSHMNSMIRFKLALTEDIPTIKTYFEDRWAELEDYKSTPLKVSLDLLDNLHKRWVILLKSLTPGQLKRKFYHPEHKREIPLDEFIALYAWHCEHHLAHITGLKERMNW